VTSPGAERVAGATPPSSSTGATTAGPSSVPPFITQRRWLSLARSRFSLFTGSSMGASKHWFRGRSKSPVQADEESAAGQASKPSPACGFRDSHGHFQALWRPSPDKDAADNVPASTLEGSARSGSTPSASRPASPVCAPSVHRYRPAESGHVFVLHCDAAGAPASRRRPASACRSRYHRPAPRSARPPRHRASNGRGSLLG